MVARLYPACNSDSGSRAAGDRAYRGGRSRSGGRARCCKKQRSEPQRCHTGHKQPHPEPPPRRSGMDPRVSATASGLLRPGMTRAWRPRHPRAAPSINKRHSSTSPPSDRRRPSPLRHPQLAETICAPLAQPSLMKYKCRIPPITPEHRQQPDTVRHNLQYLNQHWLTKLSSTNLYDLSKLGKIRLVQCLQRGNDTNKLGHTFSNRLIGNSVARKSFL